MTSDPFVRKTVSAPDPFVRKTVRASEGPTKGSNGQGHVSERERGSSIRGTTNNNNNNTHIQSDSVFESLSLTDRRDLVRLTLRVPGHAKTQGSKKAIPLKNGKAALVEAGGEAHKGWRHAVNDQARRYWKGPPLTGPVELDLVFAIQPPKKLTRKQREEGPIGARSGDLDKLARAVLDALAGVVYLNDAQVRPLSVDKIWADPDVGPGVTITIGRDA